MYNFALKVLSVRKLPGSVKTAHQFVEERKKRKLLISSPGHEDPENTTKKLAETVEA